MGGFASIPLASNLPAPNIQTPAQVWQQKATLQDTQQQAQLRAQEVVDAQLKNQLQQQMLKDNEIGQKIFTTPDPALEKAPAAASTPALAASTAAPAATTTAAQPVDLAAAESAIQGSAAALPTAAPPAQPQAVDLAAAESPQPETGQAQPVPASASTSALPQATVAPAQPERVSLQPVTASQSPTGSVDNRMKAVWDSPMSYQGKVRFSNQILDMQKKVGDGSKLANELLSKQNQRYVGLIDGVLSVQDPVQQEAMYQHAKAQAVAENLPGASALPDHNPGFDGLVQQRNLHMLHADLLAEADKLPKLREDSLKLAGQTIDGVKSDQQYQSWLGHQPWQIRAELPKSYSPETAAVVKKMGLTQEQQVELPGKAADAEQKIRENISAKFNGVDNAASFTRTFDSLPVDTQKELSRAGITPETFDSKITPGKIEKWGLKTNEFRQANYQDTEAKLRQQASDIAQQRADTADRRADIAERNSSFMHERLEKLTHGTITQQQYINDLRTHDDLTHKENKAWADRQSYNEIINSKDGDKVPDPKNPGDTTKQVVSTPAVRDAYREKADAAGSEAIAHHNTAYELRKRLGGDLGERYSVPTPVQRETGQFAKPAAQPTAKPAAATPVTAKPAQQPQTKKPFPSQQIHAYAVANKWTDDQAKAYLNNNGYSVQ